MLLWLLLLWLLLLGALRPEDQEDQHAQQGRCCHTTRSMASPPLP